MAEKCKKKKNISDFVKMLPISVVDHMYHVGLLTSILAGKLLATEPSCPAYGKAEFAYYGKAAFLHDIGKVFVPRELLVKSTRFSFAEMSSMKNHTLFAQSMFDDMGLLGDIPEQCTKFVRDAAVYHHEWWDGSGYPYGISHEEIPLVARITAVCDAYDAITSRCYKAARTHRDACGELEVFSGTQFDPRLVQLFLDNEAEFSSLIRINRVRL
ncbi:MAG: HD domain-containing phosphohydrolase [Oscillospiraceae bacterium]|nr:HD domain-containing phosphohydrolase [Oscillospiraceae bacterium]